jgi:hypothetical protein
VPSGIEQVACLRYEAPAEGRGSHSFGTRDRHDPERVSGLRPTAARALYR